MSAQFTKIGNAFFRQDDSGQLTAVSDPETMKGLKSGQLGYTAVENTRGLQFANSGSSSSTSQSRDQLSFGSPAPSTTPSPNPVMAGNESSSGQPIDLQALLKERLTSALTNYKGATSIAELEGRRQELLRKQLLSEGFEDENNELTSEQRNKLRDNKGSEYEPVIQGLDKEILGIREGNKEDMERLATVSAIAEKLGLITTPKDEMELKYKQAQIYQINESIKTEAYNRRYIEAQIGKIEADIAASEPDVAANKTESLNRYNLVDEILDSPSLPAITGLTRFTTGNLPEHALTKNKVKQLLGMISLDGREKLKGSGSVSDFEFKVLQQAGTALGENLATEDFIKEAKKVQAVFANAAGMAVPVKLTDKDGNTSIVQADRDGINRAIEDGMNVEYSFD